MKDGSGCYDHSKGIDCSDGFNGGCEQLCLQQTLPLPYDATSSTIFMFCGCVEEYKLAPDGKSCLMLSDVCEGPKCLKPDSKFNDTLFGEMLHGYNNRTQHVNQGQVFQMTFRENNFIKDFPQLADGLLVIPLPVEEQCRGVLSEPLPDLQLLTVMGSLLPPKADMSMVCEEVLCFNGKAPEPVIDPAYKKEFAKLTVENLENRGDIRYDEAMGYPMVQQWRVRSNLYRVKLSTITLSAGFTNVLKILTKESSREELLSFIQHYGSHYIAEALYGSELTCIIHFPARRSSSSCGSSIRKASWENPKRAWVLLSQELLSSGKNNHLVTKQTVSIMSCGEALYGFYPQEGFILFCIIRFQGDSDPYPTTSVSMKPHSAIGTVGRGYTRKTQVIGVPLSQLLRYKPKKHYYHKNNFVQLSLANFVYMKARELLFGLPSALHLE
ncbi:hypothetical protein H8958_003051 [Nasalis larvatus]